MDDKLKRDWMLVCGGGGKPLYWIAADGERRPLNDEPPRSEWDDEMPQDWGQPNG